MRFRSLGEATVFLRLHRYTTRHKRGEGGLFYLGIPLKIPETGFPRAGDWAGHWKPADPGSKNHRISFAKIYVFQK